MLHGAGLKAVLPSRRADRIWEDVIPRKRRSIEVALAENAGRIFAAVGEYEQALVELGNSIRNAYEFFSQENFEQLSLMQPAIAAGIRSIRLHAYPEFKIELLS